MPRGKINHGERREHWKSFVMSIFGKRSLIMRKAIVSEFISPDGVMKTPGSDRK